MKNYTNCPNCGAEVDVYAEKCAYCDTPYSWCVPVKSTREVVIYADDKVMYSAAGYPFISLEEEKARNKRIDELYEKQKRLERDMYLAKCRQKIIDAVGLPRNYFYIAKLKEN